MDSCELLAKSVPRTARFLQIFYLSVNVNDSHLHPSKIMPTLNVNSLFVNSDERYDGVNFALQFSCQLFSDERY